MLKNNSHVDLEEIENLTIGHYEDNAESFRIGTKDHDVSQNIAAFLGAFPRVRSWIFLTLDVAQEEI